MTAVRALYGAAIGLGLLALWLRFSRPALPQAEAAPLPLPAAGLLLAAPPAAAPAPSYEAIVAANIFSQTRSPPSVRFSPPGRAARGAGVPVASRRPALRLYGITVGPQGAIALIDADPKIPGAEIYRVGDPVAGARLVAITDSTVTLAQPSGPLILHLQPAQRKRP
ncbi:MAG TPA: hypothetical protein VEM13_07680 [Gemmatimonadales bacterium]|nr:hypothetical protein [Gemmatimonadales bacterium]